MYDDILKHIFKFQEAQGHKRLSLEVKEFYGFESFDIAANKCVLLEEVLDEWPIPRSFIAKYCSERSTVLPVAALAYAFDEGETYHCVHLNGPYRFLNLPQGHPSYTKAFENSFQCFAEQHGFEDFVIPKIAVERLIEAMPEWGRKKFTHSVSPDSGNESLKNLLSVLNGLTPEELWPNRNHLLALVLTESGLTAKTIFGLLDGVTKIEGNSEYTRIRRWRENGRDFLRSKGLLTD